MAILREANAKPIPIARSRPSTWRGTELPQEEYARYEKIAVDASRKLVEALKKKPDVAVGSVLVPQDPLERLAYAMVGPLEARRARTTSCRRATSPASPTPSRNIPWPRAWAP